MKQYLVRSGQTVSDVVQITYGSLDYIYKFLQDNPVINGINDDLSTHHGLVVNYEEILPNRPVNIQSSFTGVSISEKYRSRSGQNIYDICLQVYGTLDKLYKLMLDSSFYNLSQLPSVNDVFIYDPTENVSQKFKTLLAQTGININTASATEAGCLGCSFDESFDYSFEICENNC